MKIIFIFFFTFLISENLYSNNIFETREYQLNFTSNDIKLIKEKKINEIKIKSFQNILSKILTTENLKKINSNDINFINSFVLNFKINNEKIINNNYFANIKINFNEKTIINYLINKKIEFVSEIPNKFLIIILEKNDLNTFLLFDDNLYYQYLKNSNNESFLKFFQIPNLDFNDRFILNEYNFQNKLFLQNEKLNKKYETKYQIVISYSKKNNIIIHEVYLYYNNQKYFISKIPTNNINYEKLFNIILLNSIDKWKQLNQINTSISNLIECNIKINNINELSYVRNLLKSNFLIKSLALKSIELNKNLYLIKFVGNIKNLKDSFFINRLNLSYQDNICNIELI